VRELSPVSVDLRLHGLHLPSYGPHEASEFSRDSGADYRRLFAARAKRSVTRGQPSLGLPGYFPDLGRRLLQRVELHPADSRRMPIGPCAFNEHVPDPAIASLGDRATSDRVSRRALTWHQTKIGHELPRAFEPPQVTDLGGKGNGNNHANAP